MNKTLYIDGRWQSAQGETFASLNPANDQVVWEGDAANTDDVNKAVSAAKEAFPTWSALKYKQRLEMLERFQDALDGHRDELKTLISKESGKPLWESDTEIGAMKGKLPISMKAYEERCLERILDAPGASSVTRFKAHGVIAVFGPYNLPGHLPNGHIIPALLAGNTIVFKPSELTPAVGEKLIEIWDACKLPTGVINLVQGGKETGIALSNHRGINGLFFTGSYDTGRILHQNFGGHPEKLLVLEMGGNNPLIVHDCSDHEAAAYATIQSAYITSGQRCVCARRLIVPEGDQGDIFIEKLTKMIHGIQWGAYDETPEPFMGPLISSSAADVLMQTQAKMIEAGAQPLIAMKQDPQHKAFLSPGLLDVSALHERQDKEHFGPLLQLIRVKDFNDAIAEANNTAFGLAAGIFSDNAEQYKEFRESSNAGVLNWNRQTTGASSAAPFGGSGWSGNHRPSAYFAADYSAYPSASLEAEQLKLPEKITTGIHLP